MSTTGTVPDSVAEMAEDAHTFIKALGFDTTDVVAFSLGGMIAQALVLKHPELVRKLILTGTGPKGGKDMHKISRITYYDILRATLTRSDPKEFLFFNRNPTGNRAAKAFVKRFKERTADRDGPFVFESDSDAAEGGQEVGKDAPADLSAIPQHTLTANGDNDRMVPSVLSEDLHQRKY